jgi:deoxyribodipyrimidine photolyase-related protein
MNGAGSSPPAPRTLVLVLGDQLDLDSPAFDGFDPARDAVLMIEAPGEAAHVRSHRARIALFLSAMRHYRDAARARGRCVHYVELDSAGEPDALCDRLARSLERLRPAQLRLVEAGEWRLAQSIAAAAREARVPLEVLADSHFLISRDAFAAWAGPGRRPLRLETFYREMRRRHGVLLEPDGEPAGGRWNFDADNRRGWPKSPAGRAGPGLIPPPEGFPPDATTREVIALVERRFPGHPGALDTFAWPVDRAQALRALAVFVDSRLPDFGLWQDAMWTATPFGWHSMLSPALNLHLLRPREVVDAAEAAWREGRAPLAAVEGFVRQVLGWREFVRGVYGLDMPGMAEANHFDHRRRLPAWYWTGETCMACAREVVTQTLRHGYSHHIQRLMVTGMFALLAEVDPREVADWYLAVYVDAVEWVELPNVAGMALYADGGRCVSKPYVASGSYIDRMSDFCGRCHYAPTDAAAAKRGKALCPVSTLYWRFVERHGEALDANERTRHFTEALERRPPAAREALRVRAEAMLADLDRL